MQLRSFDDAVNRHEQPTIRMPYPIVEDDANVVLVKLVIHVCRPAAFSIHELLDHERSHLARHIAVLSCDGKSCITRLGVKQALQLYHWAAELQG